MSKINYRVCDICGQTLRTDFHCYGFRHGYHILNKIFNSIDICNDCIEKNKYLSIDAKNEGQYINEIFHNARKYDSPDEEAAYYEGIEDALKVLNHKRLRDIKIPKENQKV